MSVRFDGLDLNSDAPKADHNEVIASESMGEGRDCAAKTLKDRMDAGGLDQGLLSVEGLRSSEVGVRCVQNDNKSNVGHHPNLANDVRAEMGLKGKSFCGRNEGVDRNNIEVSMVEVADRTKVKLVEFAVTRFGEGQEDGEVGLGVNSTSPGVAFGPVHADAHLASDKGLLINGIGSDGKQDHLRQQLKKEFKQPQDTKMESAEKADAKRDSRMIEFQKFQAEKGLFHPGDLVWGKVRSHPWWPGQIFDPSDASEKAKKYSKKDGFLIAYFGDKTFAWNEASLIKPFRLPFSRMEKQSNSESFCHAMDCALQEVSRRVEFGLACSCLPEEVYYEIKTQVVVNAGIQEESSRRDGSDEFSNAASFRPAKLVQCLKALAKCPSSVTDRLEFITARSQLQAFSSWKGFYKLPEFKMLNSWPEDVAESPMTEEMGDITEMPEDAVKLPKKKLTIQETSRGKRKNVLGDGMSLSKKEKRLTPSSVKGFRRHESVTDDLETQVKEFSVSPFSKWKMSSVGESIRKVARQLSASMKNPNDGSEKTSGENGSKRHSKTSSRKSKKSKVTQAECPPPAEMLSLLHKAARDPSAMFDLGPSESFFAHFRNSFCLENSTSQDLKNSHGDEAGELMTLKDAFKEETTEINKLKNTEDYWTDSVVKTEVEERAIFEVETSKATVTEDRTASGNCELDRKQEAGDADKKLEEEYNPTALILNFTNPESVPTESNLSKIFSQYGPLCEPGIELPKNTKRARVIFKRRCDAETAFSSAGKFSVFGHSLVSYRLHYAPTPLRKPSVARQSKKGSTSKKPVKFDS